MLPSPSIYLAASVAWLILGATIWSRTNSFGSTLASSVQSTWGSPQQQHPPVIQRRETRTREITVTEGGHTKSVPEEISSDVTRPLESSRIAVDFDLAHRQKGLLWYSTYGTSFRGAYTFRNELDRETPYTIALPYPAASGVYDNVQFLLDGRPLAVTSSGGRAVAEARVAPSTTARLEISYRSRGLTRWTYAFATGIAEVRDFELVMRTNFTQVDFPDNSLSPTSIRNISRGRELTWKYANLVSGYPIALQMPDKLQPGPLAGRISYFGPVSLFFYFFFLLLVTTIRRIPLHPMNYFFLAAAFFAFHLLLAYLVDHISIHWAFALSTLVSVGLIASYLRLVTGARFAFREAASAQILYLILFSYAFFFEGYTGLTVTIGAIATLFAAMQLTASLHWEDYFTKPPEAAQ